MTKYLIFTMSIFTIALLLVLCSQNITFHSKAYAQLPISDVKSNASRIITAATNNNNGIITIHTTNSIQGNNFNIIKQEEPVIRKAILSNVDNAIFIAKGVRSSIPNKCEKTGANWTLSAQEQELVIHTQDRRTKYRIHHYCIR